MYVGEKEKERPFVRIVIDQIAVKMTDHIQVYKAWTAKIDKMLELHIAAKGHDWEYYVDETERIMWKVNGIYAPSFRSKEEKNWAKYNRIFYSEGLGGEGLRRSGWENT